MTKKPKKSPTLTAVRRRWDTPTAREERGLQKILDIIGAYPHHHRAEVFCWLWENHAELEDTIARRQLR